MRQAQLRILATRGIEVGKSQKFRGLEAQEAIDRQGSRLVIFRGALTGPSWASIGFILDQHQIQHTVVPLDSKYFLADDTQTLRLVLEQIEAVSRASSREEIFINDIGFLVSNLRKRFDARVLIAPALILCLTLGAAVIGLEGSVAETDETPGEGENIASISCALDLAEEDFQVWLKDQVSSGSRAADGKVVIQTSMGTISLEIVQKLGSAQLIRGILDCKDGRIQKLQFRTDSQLGGGLVELGDRLDP